MKRRCLRCHVLMQRGSYCPTCTRVVRQPSTPRSSEWRKKIAPSILERDGHACTYCGRPCPHPRHHDVDHIVPLRDGGTDNERNLRTLCASYNRGGKPCR